MCWVGIGARAWLQQDQLRLIMALREEVVEERVCCNGGRAATVVVQTQTQVQVVANVRGVGAQKHQRSPLPNDYSGSCKEVHARAIFRGAGAPPNKPLMPPSYTNFITNITKDTINYLQTITHMTTATCVEGIANYI